MLVTHGLLPLPVAVQPGARGAGQGAQGCGPQARADFQGLAVSIDPGGGSQVGMTQSAAAAARPGRFAHRGLAVSHARPRPRGGSGSPGRVGWLSLQVRRQIRKQFAHAAVAFVLDPGGEDLPLPLRCRFPAARPALCDGRGERRTGRDVVRSGPALLLQVRSRDPAVHALRVRLHAHRGLARRSPRWPPCSPCSGAGVGCANAGGSHERVGAEPERAHAPDAVSCRSRPPPSRSASTACTTSSSS